MYSTAHQSAVTPDFADRYIPRRRGANIEASNYLLNGSLCSSLEEAQPTGSSKDVNFAYVNWNKKAYQKRLWSIVAPTTQKVLNFSTRSHSNKYSEASYPLWPVKSRKKPLIGPPSRVLDMPMLYMPIIYHHSADWGRNGYLATVLEHEIYLWHPNITALSTNPVTNTGGKVQQCVCWSQSAAHFAIAMDNSRVAIWDCTKNQIANEAICPCGISTCTITSLVWSSTNKLIAGCNFGRLCIWSSQLKHIKTIYRAHRGIIITIALSCNERYLATTATDGPVKIWQWPELKQIFGVDYTSPVRGVAWHPWQDSIFAAGGNVGEGVLSLWSASRIELLGSKEPPNKHCFIDNLTFSALTGELVVSYCQQQENSMEGCGKNSIVILANLEKKVDAIKWHSDRVLYLLWGEDGTKLGTAGADENLCIWDFLGTSAEIIKSYKEGNKKRKVSLNPIDNLNLFGQCIR